MPSRLLSVLGMLLGAACLLLAAALHPGGFELNRDYLSTLFRDPSLPARMFAVVGLLLFCVSIAFVFERLARAAEFSKISKILRIGGIGSMVYASLTFTPLHNLMVTIALAFFLVAVLALLWELFQRREKVFLLTGCMCLAVLGASAIAYYTNQGVSALPLGERTSFELFALWLVALDYTFPRSRVEETKQA